MSRDAKEGVIAVSGDDKKISLMEVNCETDFVAKNEDFVSFVKELSDINDKVNSDIEKLKSSLMKNQKNVLDKFNKVEDIIAGTIRKTIKGFVTPPVKYSSTDNCITS